MDKQSLNHLKNQAKKLLADIRDSREEAVARFQACFGLRAVSLMRCQHVIATESGFASWSLLRQARDVEQQLAAVMSDVPILCDNGIGTFEHWRLPLDERKAQLAEDREQLRQSADAVEKTMGWLAKNIEKRKTFNDCANSYPLKHLAEPDIGYVTNGVFIAAAIIAGYAYRILVNSPNVEFAMSTGSIRALESAHYQ
jgi:hypothetical protein